MTDLNRAFLNVALYISRLGYSLKTVARQDLAKVDGAPDKLAATFDGVTVCVADDLAPSVRLFLAVHALGHCQSWARNPASREVDPSDLSWAMPADRRVALAYAQEQEANEYGLTILARSGCADLTETVLDLMREDWLAFARYLGADRPLVMYTTDRDRVLVRSLTCPVRVAGAFDL